MRRGHGGRTPAPVRKPVVEVGGGALGPVQHLEEPLPRAVLKQQQPVLLGYAGAAVAQGSGGGKSEAAPKGWGSLHPCERGPSSRSLKDLTADCKGTNEESTRNQTPTHLRARDATPLKRCLGRGPARRILFLRDGRRAHQKCFGMKMKEKKTNERLTIFFARVFTCLTFRTERGVFNTTKR